MDFAPTSEQPPVAAPLPQRDRVYQNYLLDSTRWDGFTFRNDDIIVVTPYKSGTTWMQNIVLHLIFKDLRPRDIGAFSPWIDYRLRPLDGVLETCEAQSHRRCLKSHLPLDGTRYRPEVKYIFVGRDPRDVFMSLWNHYSAYTPGMCRDANQTPGRIGPPLEQCPDDVREFWAMWINRGWFEWESEGYPHWSNLRHSQTWWNYRHLPNLRFVHFNDLLSNLKGEIAGIASYLEIECEEPVLEAITELVTFAAMKRDAESIEPNAGAHFKGGAKTFINKGTNGRWRDALTESDLDMYADAVGRELTPDCRQWLEAGSRASPVV